MSFRGDAPHTHDLNWPHFCLSVFWSTYLTTRVAKLPTAVKVWSSWHRVADSSHSNVSKSQIDYDEVGRSTELLVLDKDKQHHDVARQTNHTLKERKKGVSPLVIWKICKLKCHFVQWIYGIFKYKNPSIRLPAHILLVETTAYVEVKPWGHSPSSMSKVQECVCVNHISFRSFQCFFFICFSSSRLKTHYCPLDWSVGTVATEDIFHSDVLNCINQNLNCGNSGKTQMPWHSYCPVGETTWDTKGRDPKRRPSNQTALKKVQKGVIDQAWQNLTLTRNYSEIIPIYLLCWFFFANSCD